MSADALPISPARFAAALPDLPISTLHLKVLELRNSIAHLDYSNEQLRPYAEGTASVTASTSGPQSQETPSGQAPGQPDQDCIDAIKENEGVIERMQERIRLVRAEVEKRGLSWAEFQAADEGDDKKNEEEANNAEAAVNGDSTEAADGGSGSEQQRHSAWTDGTFQTGTIRNGVVQMDAPRGQTTGGSLTDEELRRRLEEQLRGLGGDEEGGDQGLHL